MERIKKGRRIQGIYIYFLIRVLPILIIPVCVMIAIYYWSVETINQQTYQKNLAVLESSAKTIRRTFADMDNLISYISGSPSINKFFTIINPVKDGSTTTDMISIQRELKTLTIANDLVKNIQVYSIRNNILVDSLTNALFINRYYPSSFVIKNMEFNDWYHNILLSHHEYDIYSNLEVIIRGKTQKCILYAKSVFVNRKLYHISIENWAS